jgi:fatty acid-binding protein DegV
VARTRGEKAALEHTLDWVGTQMGTAKRGKFAVGSALSEARAHRLAEAIKSRWEAAELVVYEAGSVICAHTGTGWGVAVLPEG